MWYRGCHLQMLITWEPFEIERQMRAQNSAFVKLFHSKTKLNYFKAFKKMVAGTYCKLLHGWILMKLHKLLPISLEFDAVPRTVANGS